MLDFVTDEAGADGSVYLAITHFAQSTPGLNASMQAFSHYGIAVCGVVMIAGWWAARTRDDRTMTAALAAPIVVVLVYLVTDAMKSSVAEVRPCRTFADAFILEQCPPLSDYSFPSNHTAVAAAAAAAMFFVGRRLGVIAALAAVLMAFSRVYVGAHYPTDVVAALVFGSALGIALTGGLVLAGSRPIGRLRVNRCRRVLLAEQRTEPEPEQRSSPMNTERGDEARQASVLLAREGHRTPSPQRHGKVR